MSVRLPRHQKHQHTNTPTHFNTTAHQHIPTLQHTNTLKIHKFRKSVTTTNQRPTTHNVDTRDPTGSKKPHPPFPPIQFIFVNESTEYTCLVYILSDSTWWRTSCCAPAAGARSARRGAARGRGGGTWRDTAAARRARAPSRGSCLLSAGVCAGTRRPQLTTGSSSRPPLGGKGRNWAAFYPVTIDTTFKH